MREIRTSGSEGGGTGTTGPPYPYILAAPAGLLLGTFTMNFAGGFEDVVEIDLKIPGHRSSPGEWPPAAAA